MLIIDCKAHIKVYRISCMTRIHTVVLIKIWDNIVSFYLLDYFKLFFVSKLRAGTSKLSHENFTVRKGCHLIIVVKPSKSTFTNLQRTLSYIKALQTKY